MEPEGVLPYWQELSAMPYTEPAESNPQLHTLFHEEAF
jgi:hypothetical protein